jgi:hypothetical protein
MAGHMKSIRKQNNWKLFHVKHYKGNVDDIFQHRNRKNEKANKNS